MLIRASGIFYYTVISSYVTQVGRFVTPTKTEKQAPAVEKYSHWLCQMYKTMQCILFLRILLSVSKQSLQSTSSIQTACTMAVPSDSKHDRQLHIE